MFAVASTRIGSFFLLVISMCVVFQARSASAVTSSTCTDNSPTSTGTPYPNKAQIAKVFGYLAANDTTTFLSYVLEDVDWVIEGTHPLAGEYHNRTIFAITLERLSVVFTPQNPLTLSIINIVGGGYEAWSTIELHATGICKSGLVFDNTYAWVTRWNTAGIIVQVRAYLDSFLINQAIFENEAVEYNYRSQRNTPMIGPVGVNCKAGV